MIKLLVDANYQKGPEETICQLYQVEPDFFSLLQQEVIDLVAHERPSYPTNQGHNSNWSSPEGEIQQFSLLNRSGIFSDISSDHDRSIIGKKFFHGSRYPHLQQFISLFPHAVNFRINQLGAKSYFTQHQEDISFIHRLTQKPALRVRFHLPIATHPDAHMLMEGALYHFEPGTIYFFHNGCIHDGINWSETESRIHLIWDMLLTEETFHNMFEQKITNSILTPTTTTELSSTGYIGIDPNYKKTVRKVPYEEALGTTLCPVQ